MEETMKCIKNILTGEVKRVTNENAQKQVSNGLCVYIQKIEWKAAPGTSHNPSKTAPNEMSQKKIANRAARVNAPRKPGSRRSMGR